MEYVVLFIPWQNDKILENMYNSVCRLSRVYDTIYKFLGRISLRNDIELIFAQRHRTFPDNLQTCRYLP